MNGIDGVIRHYLELNMRFPRLSKTIIEKIEGKSSQIGNICDAIQGITPYDSYRGHSKELIKSRAFHFNERVDETCGKWLDGKHVARYGLTEGEEWLRYGEWLAAPREKKYFKGPRLLFREVPGKNKRLQATYVESIYYHGHSITPLILKSQFSNNGKETLFEILGIANSKLISWFAKYKLSNFSKNVFPKLNPQDIKNLPFPSESEQITLLAPKVEKLLKLHSEYKLISENLANFIINSTSIKALTNKLSAWPELDYKQFIKEFRKALKKAGDGSLSKLEELEWMQVFEAKKRRNPRTKT